VFGRRKREEAAAEAAREAERRSLFAKLAERPEHICPFLGLEADRTGYVDGVSSEHRCFAFGDPAPLSAEQQTRVCQERGYGNCPRYLRGVLVIPTEELEALRRPRAAAPPPPPAPQAEPTRRSRAPLAALLVLLLLVAGGAGAYIYLGGFGGVAVEPTPTAEPTPTVEPTPSVSVEPTPEPSPTIPLNAITRGELAQLMADTLGLPPATTDFYEDDNGHPYEADINRLAEEGVTLGCTETAFCPDAFATRAELASFVARALTLPDATQDYFTDDTGSPHEADINRLAEAGYTDGCAPERYCPDDTVTRVEEELSRISGARPRSLT
jgi:S-layer homology domain